MKPCVMSLRLLETTQEGYMKLPSMFIFRQINHAAIDRIQKGINFFLYSACNHSSCDIRLEALWLISFSQV